MINPVVVCRVKREFDISAPGQKNDGGQAAITRSVPARRRSSRLRLDKPRPVVDDRFKFLVSAAAPQIVSRERKLRPRKPSPKPPPKTGDKTVKPRRAAPNTPLPRKRTKRIKKRRQKAATPKLPARTSSLPYFLSSSTCPR